jgi:hypothetical protein
MKKFKNHQRPRRKYRFDIVGHNKALKIWWDSPFKFIFHHIRGNFFLFLDRFIIFSSVSSYSLSAASQQTWFFCLLILRYFLTNIQSYSRPSLQDCWGNPDSSTTLLPMECTSMGYTCLRYTSIVLTYWQYARSHVPSQILKKRL